MSYCKLDTPLVQNLMILDTDFFQKKYVPGQIVPENIKSIPVVGIVMKGVLDVYSIAYDGTDIHLNILKKNDCFRISNLFLSTELQTVITSLTHVEILYIPKKIITKQLACNSNFALDYASY